MSDPSDPAREPPAHPARSRIPEPGDEPTLTAEEDADVEHAVEQLLEEVAGPETQTERMLNSHELRGRCAIITGASRGIGRAIALDLAEVGVDVAFNFLDEGGNSRVEAQQLARELRQLEVRVFCQACDARRSEDVNQFVADAVEALGAVHILINNAGIGADRALWHMTDLEWEAVLRTNLDGAFLALNGKIKLKKSK